MSYVKEVVQFMNFELGDQIHGKLQENDPELEMPRRAGEKEPDGAAANAK